MIDFLIKFLSKFKQQEEKSVVVYLWEFTKEEITQEDNKTYLKWKNVLAIELKKVKNRLLSLYQLVRSAKNEQERIEIQARINEVYSQFNRINIIVNPQMYMIKKNDTKTKKTK